jgi:D-alanyl-lipoteichoic acid acyltransferase DltB (MBOAT superfamily)
LENVNEIILAVKGSYQPIEAWDIILPVGISFYTFQTMSYTIDVYNGKTKAEKNLSYFALYVCFFPQLVAGPIERYNNLMPQLKEKSQLVIQNISHGGRLILYGLFMKMVIADNLGVFVDSVYGDIAGTSSLNLLVGAVFYSFQIYCDFHGYTTIAIGSAKLFNVNLSENFRTPYLSTSITEFWRNWHITLTTWFRDYIYYPLGGNRGTVLKWGLAILTVFIVSGVWHGAKWTFILWGLFHALFVLIEKIVKWDKQATNIFLKVIKWGFTFTLVTALWVFFRSPDMDTAVLFFKSIGSNWNIKGIELRIEPFILLGLFLVSDTLTHKKNFALSLNKIPSVGRGAIYFVLIFLLLSRSGTDTNPFIYFQF